MEYDTVYPVIALVPWSDGTTLSPADATFNRFQENWADSSKWSNTRPEGAFGNADEIPFVPADKAPSPFSVVVDTWYKCDSPLTRPLTLVPLCAGLAFGISASINDPSLYKLYDRIVFPAPSPSAKSISNVVPPLFGLLFVMVSAPGGGVGNEVGAIDAELVFGPSPSLFTAATLIMYDSKLFNPLTTYEYDASFKSAVTVPSKV